MRRPGINLLTAIPRHPAARSRFSTRSRFRCGRRRRASPLRPRSPTARAQLYPTSDPAMQATNERGMNAYGLRPPEAISRPATSRVSSPGAKGSGTPASSAKRRAGSRARATTPCSPDRKFTDPSSTRAPSSAVRCKTPASGLFCDSPLVTETEVVVVGAGPSGATTALLIAREGHDVVLVDRARFPRDKACGEGIMPPGVAALRRMHLYEGALASGAQPIRGVTYRQLGARTSVHVPFPVPPDGGPANGLGVRRTSFDSVLVEAVRAEPRATVREAERVTGLIRTAAGAVI